MTYNVFGGTLNLALSIHSSHTCLCTSIVVLLGLNTKRTWTFS